MNTSRQLVAFAAAVALVAAACADDGPTTASGAVAGVADPPARVHEGTPGGGPSIRPIDAEPAETIPTGALSEDEIAGLVWMRQEEQLARDVYRTFADRWGLQIFDNIARSEEQHISAVEQMLDRYGIDDPMERAEPGEFVDPEVQQLYDRFVEEGSSSALDALAVGATIEEMDIADLRALAEASDQAPLRDLYAGLERGSRNHLRSFARQIEARGGSYVPTVLDDALEIISTPTERGAVDAEPLEAAGTLDPGRPEMTGARWNHGRRTNPRRR